STSIAWRTASSWRTGVNSTGSGCCNNSGWSPRRGRRQRRPARSPTGSSPSAGEASFVEERRRSACRGGRFHAGSVTRAHYDLDLAVRVKDHARIAALLKAEGWEHAPEAGADSYTAYARGGVRLELAFLTRD